jgi:thiopurine S-methyltransferase
MDINLDPEFWGNRYKEDNTPWNIGGASPPLKNYIDKIEDKNLKILIPGAGHAHEAIYLKHKGFTDVYVCDWAKEAFHNLETHIPYFPEDHKIVSDFFKLDLKVDLILEQTFFCAINPSFRPAYAQKVFDLLKEGGKVAGLLFSDDFENTGPPFGGSEEEYRSYFEPYFLIKTMENSQQSIKPRMGREFFIELEKL